MLVFGFWKDGGAVFGRESQFGSGAGAIAWLVVDALLLLFLHSSMFLLPLYSLTAAAAEFSNPAYVLEFARERGIREDLVAFLEATEPVRGSTCMEYMHAGAMLTETGFYAHIGRGRSFVSSCSPPPVSARGLDISA